MGIPILLSSKLSLSVCCCLCLPLFLVFRHFPIFFSCFLIVTSSYNDYNCGNVNYINGYLNSYCFTDISSSVSSNSGSSSNFSSSDSSSSSSNSYLYQYPQKFEFSDQQSCHNQSPSGTSQFSSSCTNVYSASSSLSSSSSVYYPENSFKFSFLNENETIYGSTTTAQVTGSFEPTIEDNDNNDKDDNVLRSSLGIGFGILAGALCLYLFCKEFIFNSKQSTMTSATTTTAKNKRRQVSDLTTPMPTSSTTLLSSESPRPTTSYLPINEATEITFNHKTGMISTIPHGAAGVEEDAENDVWELPFYPIQMSMLNPAFASSTDSQQQQQQQQQLTKEKDDLSLLTDDSDESTLLMINSDTVCDEFYYPFHDELEVTNGYRYDDKQQLSVPPPISIAKNISDYLLNKNYHYLAICIPCYNEEAHELINTMESILKNFEFIKNNVSFLLF
jgi:hypothetical protein